MLNLMEEQGNTLFISPEVCTFLFQAFNFLGSILSPLMIKYCTYRFILISGELVAGLLLALSGLLVVIGQSTLLLIVLFLFMFYVSLTVRSFSLVYVS